MSQSLPCVSSPVDGIPELLDKEYLIDYNDVDGYAKKIIELISNWEKMISVGQQNYKKSLKYEKKILEQKRNCFYERLKSIS